MNADHRQALRAEVAIERRQSGSLPLTGRSIGHQKPNNDDLALEIRQSDGRSVNRPKHEIGRWPRWDDLVHSHRGERLVSRTRRSPQNWKHRREADCGHRDKEAKLTTTHLRLLVLTGFGPNLALHKAAPD